LVLEKKKQNREKEK